MKADPAGTVDQGKIGDVAVAKVGQGFKGGVTGGEILNRLPQGEGQPLQQSPGHRPGVQLAVDGKPKQEGGHKDAAHQQQGIRSGSFHLKMHAFLTQSLSTISNPVLPLPAPFRAKGGSRQIN